MRQYETLFIINPDLDESETNNVIEGVKTTIESSESKILRIDLWGKKKLAYPVKRHNDGYFVLVIFESNPDIVRQLKTYYQIIEPIIKYIVVCFEGDVDKLPSYATASQEREGAKGLRSSGWKDIEEKGQGAEGLDVTSA